MSNELRGSEKLKAGCSDMSALSQEELEQVVGGGLLSSPLGTPLSVSSHWRVFPHGIPWPEIFKVGELEHIAHGQSHY